MSTVTIQEERAKLSFNFDDEDDAAPAREQIDRKVEEISEQAGFTARAPARTPVKRAEPASRKAEAEPARARRRRAKTGRTYPFNTKIRPETYDKICALSDKASAAEGRGVSLAEIIERAVEALEAK